MLQKKTELKLYDKFIVLTLKQAEPPITIAYALILKLVVPHIADRVFTKKMYMSVLTSFLQELQGEHLQDSADHVLTAMAELLSWIPLDYRAEMNDIVSDFHKTCKEQGRIYLYVDFIAYYCSHAKAGYEEEAAEYLRNILVLINEPDENLLGKVEKAINSLFEGL